MKQFYKKTKSKLKDRLRPPSHQSGSTSPARSHRNSEEPSSTQDREESSPHLSQVLGESATTPEPSVTPRTDAREQDAPASGHQLAVDTTPEYAKPPSPHLMLTTAG